nr:hypothetical protein [Sphingomonas sp. PAMC 26605]
MLLLPRIELHLQKRRMAPTRFGRDAINDPRLVFDLRDGRELRDATARRVRAYLDRNDQDGAGA